MAIVFVFGVLVGYPIYTFVKASVNHGVEDLGDGTKFVELKAMGQFAFDPREGKLSDIPAFFRDLDGQTVTVDGYVFVGRSAADTINSFQFVYNVSKCCFGGPPQVQERVFAVVPNGREIYNPGQDQYMRLTGKMHVAVERDDGGNVSSVYKMDVIDMRPRT